MENENSKLKKEYKVLFMPNICPINFRYVTKQLKFEETLFIVISKTFTTSETLLNVKNCLNWLIEHYSNILPKDTLITKDIVHRHFCAVSNNIQAAINFGIDEKHVFEMWEWVGGRYSVWSAVGALPLSIAYSYDIFEQFLKGGYYVDESIKNCKDISQNVAIMLGLIGFYNTYIEEYHSRCILPYSQGLSKFVDHIQQVEMESNGKSTNKYTNSFLPYETGPIIFGNCGTISQHSFFQLLHQGRKVPCEFIASAKPQIDICVNNGLSTHTELMCNFFAQPDALANGKFTDDELKDIDTNLKVHKTFKGDRPSLSILLKQLDAFHIGMLLAIYEHRIIAEGFMYQINSFDQWGVELGKTLAKDIKSYFQEQKQGKNVEYYFNNKFNSSLKNMIDYFNDCNQ